MLEHVFLCFVYYADVRLHRSYNDQHHHNDINNNVFNRQFNDSSSLEQCNVNDIDIDIYAVYWRWMLGQGHISDGGMRPALDATEEFRFLVRFTAVFIVGDVLSLHNYNTDYRSLCFTVKSPDPTFTEM